MYELAYDEKWEDYFENVPKDIRIRFAKRIAKYMEILSSFFRHERYGVPYFVDQIGQYRVCFTSNEKNKRRKFYFIGDHKEYEKWLAKHK